MTRIRYDSHSTEFGLWLREQKPLDSSLGYIATNLDYIWKNYKTDQYMLIEEKRYGAKCKFPQTSIFKQIHLACRSDPKYFGFYVVIFEKTSPDDGMIWINNIERTAEELIDLLMFKPLKKD